MNSGTISLADVPGGLDLQATLESAQTFLWRRSDGRTYAATAPSGGEARYHTVIGDDVVSVRQRADHLEWRSTTDGADVLRHRLRLDDDLDAIFAGFPEAERLDRARRELRGLRVVRDPFFPCLVSFICSARMSVRRIFEFQCEFAREFGETVLVDGERYHAFPEPERLAAASEDELRDVGIGFRAPYVAETAAMVADGELTEADLREESYRDARRKLQEFPGVGPKVADCVALFALGHLQAVPIDTWTRRLVATHFPDVAADSYEATADAFRDRFGEHAGYAQTYLYHYERAREGAN